MSQQLQTKEYVAALLSETTTSPAELERDVRARLDRRTATMSVNFLSTTTPPSIQANGHPDERTFSSIAPPGRLRRRCR